MEKDGVCSTHGFMHGPHQQFSIICGFTDPRLTEVRKYSTAQLDILRNMERARKPTHRIFITKYCCSYSILLLLLTSYCGYG